MFLARFFIEAFEWIKAIIFKKRSPMSVEEMKGFIQELSLSPTFRGGEALISLQHIADQKLATISHKA